MNAGGFPGSVGADQTVNFSRLREKAKAIQGAHIAPYSQGTWTNHAARRKRKLLLHKAEILKLAGKSSEKGFTIVPLEMYFLGSHAKVVVALARGKKEYDKRQTLREQQDMREAQRAMRRRELV